MQKLSMDQLQRADVESFKKQEKTAITLVLDNVRSMHNVGSAFRTADGFAIEKIFLCGITATPPHREIEKTALGATQSIPWEHIKETTEAINILKEQGYTIIAIEQAENSVLLQNFIPSKDAKYALVFGNEVNGVDEEVMEQIDHCIEIPQFGTKHSFNVSVTIGIVTWDFIQKSKFC
ncbi:RNA methyltransferase [Sphingobacterium sp. SG20118]|uniref:RNA methyltransferase n=1 Tax=Sphingobacterium TaxID=28453 RepID=UPI0004F6A462|nr:MULTISPECIES: RNA methyltransferase [Sphingobacterium]AIM35994.1 RNA methyltransferase [Sphingobacterium sp. ML3W]MDH5827876.1 RNA methyltransferase [Sphingobacterium faecium]